jgi:outer membrane protein TolC
MKPLALATLLSFVTAAAAVADDVQLPVSLTFDEALSRVAQRLPASSQRSAETDLRDVKKSLLPSVRAEVNANASRTLDLFSQGPYEVRFATAALAFDYPLWDGGAMRERAESVEERVRREARIHSRVDDRTFAELLEVYGELLLVQQQAAALKPFQEQLSRESEHAAALLESGEISNLTAIERSEAALNFSALLLDLAARQTDAAEHLRALTGVSGQPLATAELNAPAEAFDLAAVSDDAVDAANAAMDESRTRFQMAKAANGFRANLSGFAGIGSAESEFSSQTSDGSFGVYGFRVLFSYPLFGGPALLSTVESRLDLANATATRDEALRAARARAVEVQKRMETAQRRIALIEESIQRSVEREASLGRLVSAGVRSESDLLHARGERARRESDLLAARVDAWKARRMLARLTERGAESAGTDQP